MNHKPAVENALLMLLMNLYRVSVWLNVGFCPIVCSPLSVVTNASGKRLVLDLRYVNQFLPDCKFKYEGLELVPTLFNCGNYFTTFDLKSGYHHVDIHEDSWPYLGFSWNSGRDRKLYTFQVLPFGLSTACYVFTKLLRQLVKGWRSRGLQCIVYIDDGICASKSQEQCTVDTKIIVDDLAGFILNRTKSKLSP